MLLHAHEGKIGIIKKNENQILKILLHLEIYSLLVERKE